MMYVLDLNDASELDLQIGAINRQTVITIRGSTNQNLLQTQEILDNRNSEVWTIFGHDTICSDLRYSEKSETLMKFYLDLS